MDDKRGYAKWLIIAVIIVLGIYFMLWVSLIVFSIAGGLLRFV